MTKRTSTLAVVMIRYGLVHSWYKTCLGAVGAAAVHPDTSPSHTLAHSLYQKRMTADYFQSLLVKNGLE